MPMIVLIRLICCAWMLATMVLILSLSAVDTWMPAIAVRVSASGWEWQLRIAMPWPCMYCWAVMCWLLRYARLPNSSVRTVRCWPMSWFDKLFEKA